MVRQESVDVRAGHVRVGGPVDGIAGNPVSQREIDLFEVGEAFEFFPDPQVQVPRRDDLESGLDDEPRAPGLLVRPVLPAEHVPSRRRDDQAAAGPVPAVVLTQKADPFELAKRGEDLRSFFSLKASVRTLGEEQVSTQRRIWSRSTCAKPTHS